MLSVFFLTSMSKSINTNTPILTKFSFLNARAYDSCQRMNKCNIFTEFTIMFLIQLSDKKRMKNFSKAGNHKFLINSG